MNNINLSPTVKSLDTEIQFTLRSSLAVMVFMVFLAFLSLYLTPKVSLMIPISLVSFGLLTSIFGIFKFEKWIQKRAKQLEKEKVEEKFDFLSKNGREVELSLNSLYNN